MNLKAIFFVVTLVLLGCGAPTPPVKPKLMVGIVIDQMRMDYLYRFQDHYRNEGFHRFFTKGFIAKNHHFDYAQTETGPGHASISTGTTPAIHGVIANNWFDKTTGKILYCVDDVSFQGVGTSNEVGQKAPTQLLVSTFADENRLATQMHGKAVSVSLKDRGAILSIGHTANGAYWFSGGDEGNFVSSTFYMNSLPQWVVDFNSSRVIDTYLTSWDTFYPIDKYIESGPDSTPYEATFKGKDAPTFPYELADLAEQNGGYDVLKSTPFGNSLLTDFALAALEGEKLGTDQHPDVFIISYSSTDYAGHKFGVNSKEIQDIYVRLDMELARLFKALDAQVGRGEYTVFLTSDHAASHVSDYLMDNQVPAGYFNQKEFIRQLNNATKEQFGIPDLIRNVSNNEIFLNHEQIRNDKVDIDRLNQFVVSFSLSYKGIAAAYPANDLMKMNENNVIIQRLQRGYHPKRSGDIVFMLLPGYTEYGPTGSTHGSAYVYDTHAPLLLMGKGVRKGTTFERTNTSDIAPTVSALLGISNPSGTIGNPIGEALLKR